jgi:hypothetical protein
MLFGSSSSFAVEAIPGPEAGLPRFVGSSLAGRVKVHVGGQMLGDSTEPCCVYRPLAEHLTTLCASAAALWHESLEGLGPSAIFETLDRARFHGQDEPYPPVFDLMGFLTNISECFDNVKGFVAAPREGTLLVLAQLQPSGMLISHEVAVAQWAATSASFAAWLHEQERTHGASEA